MEAEKRAEEWWKNWTWREIQTNLREIDMADIDAKSYVEELKKFKATVVLLNTSGIIASYKTFLPFHFQSEFLTGDSLQQIIKECHNAGIKVIARTDFSKVRMETYETHPEWAYISSKGKIIDYDGDVHVCPSGEYQQKYSFEIIKETLEELDVDGIFFNMSGYQVRDYSRNYYGICHCESCKKKFFEIYRLSLPEEEDMNDPIFRKYLNFKNQFLNDFNRKVYDFIYSMKPEICIELDVADTGFLRCESSSAMDSPLPHWQYSSSDITSYIRTSFPKMIADNTSVDFIDIAYRHVSVSPDQTRLRLVQSLAHGGVLSYYQMGRLDNHEDRSSFQPIKEMFAFHEKNKDDYRQLESDAHIALICGANGNTNEYRGWFRFLTEGHFIFDSLIAEKAINKDWAKYKTVIVPDYNKLSEDFLKKADEYVFNGGTLISVSFSGSIDDTFETRQSPAFKCLGVESVSLMRQDMRGAYFRVSHKDKFERLHDADLIYIDGKYIYADYCYTAEKYFNLMPPQHYGPPERCYYTITTDHPAFTVNSYGKGKGVFIPWNPGELFYRQGYTNTVNFIQDLLENVCCLIPVKGNLSPMVEVTMLKSENGEYELLHLINGTGHFGTSFYSPVKISDTEVVVEYEGSPQSVKSLVAGNDYIFSVENKKLHIKIPVLGDFDAIKIVR